MIWGIDYARVDGNRHPIDFAAAYAAGCRFAYLRAAYGTLPDTVFRRDRAALKGAGIACGAYLFLRCPLKRVDVPTPEEQAQALVDVVGPLLPGELPPVIDVEFPGYGRSDTTLSARQAVAWYERAYDALRNSFGVVGVYTSARVWAEDLADLPSKMSSAPLWLKVPYYWQAGRVWDLSHYHALGAVPPPWRTEGPGAWFQQIQGDAVKVPGFSATVDINLFLPMQHGEKSLRVTAVQRHVGATPDGDFGARTEMALRSFQRSNALPDTGIVDVATFAALCR